MFDKQLFDKICNADLPFDRLESFVDNIDRQEFDTDRPFEKYYSLERILSVIEKYQENEITDSYLANWMDAYKWIVMGGFHIENEDAPINLKEFIMWQICHWLDGLSFFRRKDEYELEKYKVTFKTLDRVYNECDSCDGMFSPLGVHEHDIIALIINYKSKYYIKAYSRIAFINNKLDFKSVKLDEIRNRIAGLSELGYKELLYGIFDDTDFD